MVSMLAATCQSCCVAEEPCRNFTETYKVLLQSPKRKDVAPDAIESGFPPRKADLSSLLVWRPAERPDSRIGRQIFSAPV
jgi:hypothetical protein